VTGRFGGIPNVRSGTLTLEGPSNRLGFRAGGRRSYDARGRSRDGGAGPAEYSGVGQVADWVLLLTDEAGAVTAHYMDITATVTSLPKYGTLRVDARSLGPGTARDAAAAAAGAPSGGLDWRDGGGRDAALYDAGYRAESDRRLKGYPVRILQNSRSAVKSDSFLTILGPSVLAYRGLDARRGIFQKFVPERSRSNRISKKKTVGIPRRPGTMRASASRSTSHARSASAAAWTRTP